MPRESACTPFAAASSLCAASTISTSTDIELVLARDGGNFCRRPDEDGNDESGLGGLHSAPAANSRRRDARRWSSPPAPAWRGQSNARISHGLCTIGAISEVAISKPPAFDRCLVLQVRTPLRFSFAPIGCRWCADRPPRAPNSCAIRCNRSAASPTISPRAPRT